MDAGNPTVAWIPRRVEFEPDPARPPPPNRLRCEPFDTSPFQLNAGDVAKLLERFYPKDLRAGGVGGSVVLWLFVDESGNVTRHDVKVSSGFEALDLAAVSVARMLRFAPAKALGIPHGGLGPPRADLQGQGVKSAGRRLNPGLLVPSADTSRTGEVSYGSAGSGVTSSMTVASSS